MKIKIFAIMVVIITIITFASSSFLPENKKIDERLYSTIINSSLKNLSTIFKITTEDIIKKLNDNNIRILNKNQTIIEVALSNAKTSNEIINILLSH